MAEKARDIQIKITASPEASRKIGYLNQVLPSSPPDYGDDDLHNARLVGAYHARKGAGGQYLARWKASLRAGDLVWIKEYERRGEWGNTSLPRYREPGLNAAIVTASGLAAAVTPFASAMQAIGDQYEAAFAGIGKAFAAAGEDLARSFAAGLQPADPEEYLIIVERINLRHNLERLLIPSVVACWLAHRWPSWALPAVAWVRLRRRWHG